jgi:Glyoxalase-like domain
VSGLELDHVVIAAADLDTAARELEDRYGLASIPGGRHPDWGTANRIVPLGATYLELIAVVDEPTAARTLAGRWVKSAPTGQPLGWAVRTNDLDAIAGRLGLMTSAGSRVTPDGEVLRWRSAGLEDAVDEPTLPFFIEWHPDTPFPGGTDASPFAISKLELEGDPGRLAAWLDGHSLPLLVREGTPRVARVVLPGPEGEIVLGTP